MLWGRELCFEPGCVWFFGGVAVGISPFLVVGVLDIRFGTSATLRYSRRFRCLIELLLNF